MDEKNEVLLNLSLEASKEEREKSLTLNVGVDEENNLWEVIVKYNGNLSNIMNLFPNIDAVDLGTGYAVFRLPKEDINLLATSPQIEYVEKPKGLYFTVAQGRRVSCINPIQNTPPFLTGKGTLIGVIDSGIDYTHPDFQNPDGTTRIKWLWDQTLTGTPPTGYYLGQEFSNEDINRALSASTPSERMEIVPSVDTSGHGTFVTGIAAGNGRSGGNSFQGVAPDAELIIVKLGTSPRESFPRTTQLMTGLNYVIQKAEEAGLPIAINISFGNSYGSHTGTSLLESYFDQISDVWKNVIVTGSGNEGIRAGHASGTLNQGENRNIELEVGNFEPALNVQLWKSYTDDFQISLRSPGGQIIGPLVPIPGAVRYRLQDTELLIYYGEPRPYSNLQEIYFDFLPIGSYINPGVWQIELFGEKIVSGNYELWLPSAGVLSSQTKFLRPSEERTLTIPSTSAKVITVGAYNALNLQYADFSGRGYLNEPWGGKPDLAAPGVNVTSTVPGGGYGSLSGTSFATPFVTGSAALLMEWGITDGNDPFLYGEKLKAYLHKGARPLPGFNTYPNSQVGWGALCVADSLPR